MLSFIMKMSTTERICSLHCSGIVDSLIYADYDYVQYEKIAISGSMFKRTSKSRHLECSEDPKGWHYSTVFLELNQCVFGINVLYTELNLNSYKTNTHLFEFNKTFVKYSSL